MFRCAIHNSAGCRAYAFSVALHSPWPPAYLGLSGKSFVTNVWQSRKGFDDKTVRERFYFLTQQNKGNLSKKVSSFHFRFSTSSFRVVMMIKPLISNYLHFLSWSTLKRKAVIDLRFSFFLSCLKDTGILVEINIDFREM